MRKTCAMAILVGLAGCVQPMRPPPDDYPSAPLPIPAEVRAAVPEEVPDADIMEKDHCYWWRQDNGVNPVVTEAMMAAGDDSQPYCTS
jgi:hypothetical protein